MKYFVYELSDPSEADIPVYVSWGLAPTPWDTLWNRLRGLEPQVDVWFAELRGANEKPIVSRKTPIPTLVGAQSLARFRTEEIVKWSGGQWPSWLLNKPWWVRPVAPRLAAKAVTRRFPDGQEVRYPSLWRASLDSGSRRQNIATWCRSGLVAPDGCRWWFEFDD